MITRIAYELAVAFRTTRCPDRQTLARQIATELAAAEERGRRAGIEEATSALTEARDALEQIWAAIGDRLCGKGPLAKEYAQSVASKADAAAKRIRALAPRDSGKEPDFLAAMDAVRDDLKRKGVRVNTVEMLTELYEGRGHSHEEALRMARGEPDPEDRK